MKHSTLYALTLALAASDWCGAATPAFVWSKALDGSQANEQNRDVVVTTDGNFVSYNSFQSDTDGSPCSFGDDVIAKGSSISSNRNLVVVKTDASGNKLWSVYSKEGYFDASNGAITATADGGVLILTKPRPSDNNGTYLPAVLVDAAGDETEIYDMNTSAWIYNQMLIKIQANGSIEWAKIVLQDQLPVPAASTNAAKVQTTDGVNPYAMATDTEGNIYIAGNYRSPMVLSNAKNGCFVLLPRNIATYSGDPQATAGSLYLVKLDPEGGYLSHLKAEGDNNYEKINGLSFADGKLYFNGNIKGNGDRSSLTMGTQNFEIGDDDTLDHLFAGVVNAADMSAAALWLYPSFANSANRFVLQSKTQMVDGDKLYVCGAVNGGIGEPGATTAAIATEGTMLEAFALQINTADGAITRSYCEPGKTITGYSGCFVYDSKAYFLGYTIAQNAFLDSYPADGEWTDNSRFKFLISNIGMANSAAVNGENAMLICRANTSKSVTIEGAPEDVKPTTSQYGEIFVCYDLNGTVALDDLESDASGLNFTGEHGSILVSAAEETEVRVYDMAGQLVAEVTAPSGTSRIALGTGIYLANGVKVAVK